MHRLCVLFTFVYALAQDNTNHQSSRHHATPSITSLVPSDVTSPCAVLRPSLSTPTSAMEKGATGAAKRRRRSARVQDLLQESEQPHKRPRRARARDGGGNNPYTSHKIIPGRGEPMRGVLIKATTFKCLSSAPLTARICPCARPSSARAPVSIGKDGPHTPLCTRPSTSPLIHILRYFQ